MFDALTMAAITRELTQRLHGGRIQAAVQIDALSVAFEVYASRSRRWLVLSADPVHNRMRLNQFEPARATSISAADLRSFLL